MLQCKYCGHSCSKLAKAHIIPRSFYKVVRSLDKYSVELKVKENNCSFYKVVRSLDKYSVELKVKENNSEKPKYWQSGIHDSKIVCESCEKLFNPFDTHGYEVLSAALSQKKVCYGSDRQPYAYLVENADYHKLKLFFLSMLWRAHASSLTFFLMLI